MNNMKVNKQYKDRLFKFIFGNPENKEWTLELYNAVNNSNYKNADDICYNTIDDAIYMGMKNDISFIIENTLSIYEQQSTYCPNMPLRCLLYLAKLYEGYIKDEIINIYSTSMKNIPQPKCICFYNGRDEKEDRKILKLSEMYFKRENNNEDTINVIVELEVLMINVNFGHNNLILDKCKPLYEYSYFVDKVRYFEKNGFKLAEAIDKAIESMPSHFKILKFILKHRQEVKDMCLFEYDEEQHMKAEREEAKEEGREEGRKEGEKIGEEKGKIENMLELVHDGIIDKKIVADKLGITIEEVEKRLKEKYK